MVSSAPFDNVGYLCMLWYLSVLNLEAGDKQVYMIYQGSSSNGARLCLLFVKKSRGSNMVPGVAFDHVRYI